MGNNEEEITAWIKASKGANILLVLRGNRLHMVDESLRDKTFCLGCKVSLEDARRLAESLKYKKIEQDDLLQKIKNNIIFSK